MIRITDYDCKDMKKSMTYDTERNLKKTPSSPYLNHMGNPTMSQSLSTLPGLGYGSVYMKMWNSLCVLETDPYLEVAQMCCAVTGYIRAIAKVWNKVNFSQKCCRYNELRGYFRFLS